MNRLSIGICCLTLLLALKAEAAQLPDNGDFETGVLTPWISDDDPARRAEIVTASDCFQGHDTSRAAPRGRFAARLTPLASLQSARFQAGEAIGFIALHAVSTSSEDANLRDALQVELLDADSNAVLARQLLSPARLIAGATCGSAGTDQGDIEQLSSHYVSTRAFIGSPIRIRFQNMADSQQSLFILLDQLVIFSPGEHTLFQSRPHARAGFYFHSQAGTALSSRGSIDPDNHPLPLRYGWYLEGKEYLAANPCLDDLPPGDYRAVLYVNDGHHAVSDALRLWIPHTYPDTDQAAPQGCDFVSAQVLNPATATAMAEEIRRTPDQAGEVRRALLDWAGAWSDRNLKRYVNAYSNVFTTSGISNRDWAADRRWNFENKKYIRVTLSDIKISPVGDRYRASFTQEYESDNYSDVVTKELLFVRESGQWKIVEEVTP